MRSSNKFRKPLQVQRYQGADVNGRWKTAKEGAEFTILASIQPLKAETRNAIANMKDGVRFSEGYTLYSNTELLHKDEELADRVIINGEEFEVLMKDPWQNGLIDHLKYVVIKRDRV